MHEKLPVALRTTPEHTEAVFPLESVQETVTVPGPGAKPVPLTVSAVPTTPAVTESVRLEVAVKVLEEVTVFVPSLAVKVSPSRGAAVTTREQEKLPVAELVQGPWVKVT